MNAPVTRAVLLAAGRGTRLGALTEHTPKPLLHVGGQPILHRILGGLRDGGVRDAAIVTGHLGPTLEEATGDGSRWGMSLSYFRQDTLDGTARALSLARELLSSERFFLGWGDIVVGAENYGSVLSAAIHSEAVLAVNEVDDPSAGGAVYVDGDWQVSRLVEKPPAGTSSTRWNNAGLMVLSQAIWPCVERLEPSPRGEYELPQAVAAAIAGGMRTTAVPIRGPWFDVGTPESLAAARAHFGE